MHNSKVFNYVTGISAFLSTLVWFFFLFLGARLSTGNMEEFLSLHQNPLLVVKYSISYACFVFSIIALSGLYIRIKHQFYGLPLIALIFFIVGSSIDFVYRAIEGITMHFIWAKNYLEATDELVKADYLAKIDLFNEYGESVFVVFGIFFVASWMLFGICTWKIHKLLSLFSVLISLFIAILYTAAFFSVSIPQSAWIFYEIISITFYITLGQWLLKGKNTTS